jgi:2'-5' RNA ligase
MSQKRSILLFPDLSNRSQIERYRDRFDPLARKIPPHVTLVFPFESPDFQTNDLASHVAERIATVRAFTLEAALPAIVENECIYLKVTHGAEQVRRLHDSLYAGVLHPLLRTDLHYAPHITIGRYSEKTADDARRSSNELSGPFKTLIREVIIESFYADGHSVVEARLALKE